MSLGKLKKVNLRKIWKHEALDFTKWLAKEENLALLSDEIGVDLRLIQTEASVGKFNVDILAEVESSGRKVVIENQLESTNHSHLGQIITYASGYDAEIIIWIVRSVRDEHKQAVDWLNEHSDEQINFFLIEIELWQIGDSPPAPKFKVVSSPNNWAKTVKQSGGKSKLTETKLLQLEFWTKFNEYLSSHKTNLSIRKPYPQHWYDMSIGTSIANLSLSVNTQKNKIYVALWIHDSKEMFNNLYESKDQIEKAIGMKLEWLYMEGKKSSVVRTSRSGDIYDYDSWNEYFAWLEENASKFKRVFGKWVKKGSK